jgi:hypothetical protein
MPRVGQALGADDSEGQAALAEPLATVQAMVPAGPQTFPRVPGPTRAGRGTTRLRARTMGDRPMVLGGGGVLGAVGGIGAARRPAWPLGDAERWARGGAPMLQDVQRAGRGGRGRVGRVAAVH